MEKASDGSPRISRKNGRRRGEDDHDHEDEDESEWDITLNGYAAGLADRYDPDSGTSLVT